MQKFDYEFKKRALIKDGFLAFKQAHYAEALRLFSEVLFLDKDNQKAKIGALLSDIAKD
ncbi:histidine kinase, partial [Helicobacter pylori]